MKSVWAQSELCHVTPHGELKATLLGGKQKKHRPLSPPRLYLSIWLVYHLLIPHSHLQHSPLSSCRGNPREEWREEAEWDSGPERGKRWWEIATRASWKERARTGKREMSWNQSQSGGKLDRVRRREEGEERVSRWWRWERWWKVNWIKAGVVLLLKLTCVLPLWRDGWSSLIDWRFNSLWFFDFVNEAQPVFMFCDESLFLFLYRNMNEFVLQQNPSNCLFFSGFFWLWKPKASLCGVFRHG